MSDYEYPTKRWAKLNKQVPDLLGSTAFAELLKVKPGNLNKVADLPPHCKVTGRGPVWRQDIAEEFAAIRRERLGLAA